MQNNEVFYDRLPVDDVYCKHSYSAPCEDIICNGYKLVLDQTITTRIYNLPYPRQQNEQGFWCYSNILWDLFMRGSIFWLDKAGKICHMRNNEIKIVDRKNLSQLLETILRRPVYVFQNFAEYSKKYRKESEQYYRKQQDINNKVENLKKKHRMQVENLQTHYYYIQQQQYATLPMHMHTNVDNTLKSDLWIDGNNLKIQQDIEKQNLMMIENSFLPEQPINNPNNIFFISDLLMLQDDVFDVYALNGFIVVNNNIAYRNMCILSPHMISSKRDEIKSSVIVQYLYYISNYNINKFNYIMNWLAEFVQDISVKKRDKITQNSMLVFIGDKLSVIDVFINNVLKPMFGFQHCLDIDDSALKSKSLKNELRNKLLFIFNNISFKQANDNNNLINNIINLNAYTNPQFVGKKIMVMQNKHLPYNIKCDFATFKIQDNIQDFKYRNADNNIKTERDLIGDMVADLDNFANILRAYVLTNQEALTPPKDIDIFKEPNLDDCILEFVAKIENSANLIKDIEGVLMQVDKSIAQEKLEGIYKLYNKHRKIERQYIYKLFKVKYYKDITPNALYKKLLNIKPILFNTVLAPGGAKCFYFPDKN